MVRGWCLAFGSLIPRCLRLLLTASFGNRPLSLEPRKTIEQFGFRAFNIDIHLYASFAGTTIVFVWATSLEDHCHQRVGLLQCPFGGNVLDEVGAILDGIIPILGELRIGITPSSEVLRRSSRGMSGKGY